MGNPLDAVLSSVPPPSAPPTQPQSNPLDDVLSQQAQSQAQAAQKSSQQPNPLDVALSGGQPPAAPAQQNSLDAAVTQAVKKPLSETGQLAQKLTTDLMPEGSLARRVLLGEKLPDGTWNKIKSIANMPIMSGLTDVASALPVMLSDVGEYELRKTNHPTLAKIVGSYAGEKRGEADIEHGMSSPLNLGIMAATGGLGSVEGAASSVATKLGLSKEAIALAARYGPQVARLVNAGFAINGIKSAYQSIPEVKKAFDAGDTDEVARLLTQNVANLGMSVQAGIHALGSVLPEGVSTEEEARARKSKTAIQPVESVAAAPLAKVVDTATQADAHLENAKAEAAQGKTAQPVAKPSATSAPAAAPYEYKPLDVTESTEGKVFHHGTRSSEFTNIEEAQPSKSSAGNLFGPGFYLTDNPEVAGRYGQHGNVLTGKLGDLSLIDLEGKADARLLNAIKASVPETDFNEIQKTAGENATGKDLYSAFRNQVIKEHGGDSLAEYQMDLIEQLNSARVDGFRYEGTKLGTTKDNAVVLFPDQVNGATLGTLKKIGAYDARTTIGESESGAEHAGEGNQAVGEPNAPGTSASAVGRTRTDVAPVSGQAVPAQPTATVVPESYVPAISRDAVLAEATQRVVNNSPILQEILDPAKLRTSSDIDTALDAARKHIQSGNDPRVGTHIGFEQIKNLARDLNLKPEELLSSPSGEAANAETVTAARMLLQRSGENVLELAKAAVSTPDSNAANAKADLAAAMAKHVEISDKVRAYAAEAGRALVSHRISTDVPANKIAAALSKVPHQVLDQAVRIAGGLDKADPNYEAKANQVLKIADALQSTKPETLDLAARLLSKIDPTEPGYIFRTNKLISEITPSTTADKLFEIYRNFLLSSPSTPIKKTASEAMMALLETATKGLRGGVEQGKAKLEGRTPDALASDGFWFAKGAVKALSNAPAVLKGEFDLADAPGFEDSYSRANKGVFGKIIRTPAEILSRLTNLVYMSNYYGELESQAARQAKSEGLSGDAFAARQEWLVSNPSAEMIKAANDTALHGTFQQELGKTGGAVQAAIKANPVAKFLFPFVKTPINLVKATAEYSPYGAVKGTLKGDLTAQTRGIVGSSLAAGVAYLAAQGLVTGGGPVDFRQREAKEAIGWQPYSLHIGDKYYRYNRAEPLGLLFSAVADTVHGAMKDEDPAITGAKAQSALDHIGRNVEDLPFLMQLSGIVNSLTHIGQGHAAERIVDNLLASAVVPAGVKAIAQTNDRTMRSPERNGLLTDPGKGLLQTIEERVPGLTKNVPADIDITGQPVQRPVSALGGANPFPVTEDKKNFALNELARLGVTVGNAPQTITLHRNGVPVTFTATPDEARQIQQAEITQFWTTMQRVISQPGWTQLPDFEKKRVVDSVHKRVVENRVSRLFQLRQQEGQPRPTPSLPNLSSSQPQ